MKRYVILDKKSGETPLAALEAWKRAHPEYASIPASYAGRLDPMASGKLLILLGQECKRQKQYIGLDKEYEIELLLDAGTDTGDALGLVEYPRRETRPGSSFLKEALRSEKGKHRRAYPAFSSKTVAGKPLFLHALEGTFDSIAIPEHEERIYEARLQGTTRVTSAQLRERIYDFLSSVPKTDEPSKMLGADFRIDSVRRSWERLLEDAGKRDFIVAKIRVVCGSGTYMRSLAGRIGETLGTKGLALSIRRTKIGKYRAGFWFPSYS